MGLEHQYAFNLKPKSRFLWLLCRVMMIAFELSEVSTCCSVVNRRLGLENGDRQVALRTRCKLVCQVLRRGWKLQLVNTVVWLNKNNSAATEVRKTCQLTAGKRKKKKKTIIILVFGKTGWLIWTSAAFQITQGNATQTKQQRTLKQISSSCGMF